MKSLIHRLPLNLKRKLFKLKLYIKAPKLILYCNAKFQSNQQPTLLLSLPRSGSSWIGSIFGSSESLRYLREPITTSYMQKKTQRLSVFQKECCDNWNEYKNYINNSLAGTPNFTNSVIPSPAQWDSPNILKPLVIKEVNPLVIDEFLEHSVNCIYLVRHPFSVARSFNALNWAGRSQFSDRFEKQELKTINKFYPHICKQNFWVQMGYLQGWVEASVKSRLNMNISHIKMTIIRYEDICKTPKTSFKALFKLINIDYNQSIESAIEKSLAGQSKVSAGKFSLIRVQNDVAKIKISPKESNSYHELMAAYNKAFIDYSTQVKSSEQNSQSYLLKSSLVEFTKEEVV